MSLLDQIRARITDHLAARAAAQTDLDALLASVEARGDGSLTAEETARLAEIRASLDTADAKITEARASEAEFVSLEERRAAAAAVTVPAPAPTGDRAPIVTVRHEPKVYEGRTGLYVRDLVRANPVFGLYDPQAQERLNRHAQELRTELGSTLDAERTAVAEMERRDVGRSTDAEVGYFVPPLYAISDYAEALRAARPFADLVGPRPLPGGIDAVNIPRLTTGTLTAVQNGDNAAVTTRDVVTAETTASLVTIAGYADISVQAIDQAPIDMQQVLFVDLAADYAMQLDTLLFSGSGSSGQPIGVLNLNNTNGTTYTATTGTAAGLWPKVGEAVAELHTTRYMPAEVVVMHPRRWGHFTSALDSSNRPFAGFSSSAPMNVGAAVERVAPENRVGTMHGLPVVVDANVPITLGSGTNEDRIIVARPSDARLWESTPRMQALPIVDATTETLTVRLKYWSYVIFLPGRFPTAWSIVSGTGLATPVF